MGKKATILTVRTADLDGLQGVVPIPEDFNPAVWAGPRELLEYEPAFRQIIPYIAVKTSEGYLTYIRGDAGGEERLKAKATFGVGGHTDAKDAIYNDEDQVSFWETVNIAALREIEEEIGVKVTDAQQLKPTALIITDEGADLVHLGVVMIWDISDVTNEFTFEEGVLEKTQFLTKEQLMDPENGLELESWSQKALTLLP